jgi:hypothetical protein
MAGEPHEKVRVDLTKEQRPTTDDVKVDHEEVFEVEELEERIAPAQVPVLDTGIL